MKQTLAIVLTFLMVASLFSTGTSVTGIASAEEPTDALSPGLIASCGVIEQPGEYILTTDLDNGGSATPCFEIKTSDVVLDGNGYTISNGTAEAIHALGTGSLQNVTVTHLRIEDWETGISAKNIKHSTFSDNEFVGNHDKAVALSGSSSQDNVVSGNEFRDNVKGVFLEQGITGTVIDDNDFVRNHEVGVKVMGAKQTTLSNNYFTGHDGEKTIHFTGRSPNNVVVGNVVEYSDGPENAIQFGGESSGNEIRDNVVRFNTLGGISLGPGSNVVENNSIHGNGAVGLTLEGGSNTVSDNEISDNEFGLWVAGSSDNVLTNNVVKNNAEWDVYALEGATTNEFTGLVLDDSGTTLDVGASSIDVALGGASDPGVTAPGDYAPIDRFFEATNTSAGAVLDVTVHYAADDVVSGPEDNLVLAHTDGVETWAPVDGVNDVDTSANAVHAVVTDFGVFAPITGTTPAELFPPVADAGADQTVLLGAPVALDASASTDNVGITAYEWDLGDGNATTGSTVSYTYAAAGTYTVTLTVRDAAGNEGTDTVVVTVLGSDDTAPTAVVAGGDRDALVGSPLTFDGSDSTDNVGIASYEWDFGDGTNATGAAVGHTYAQSGTYTVSLTVTDDTGNNDTVSVTVTTVDADAVPPTAVIDGVDSVAMEGDALTFDGTGSTDNIEIASYEWDFGDNATATGAVVTHTYATHANYTVTLTVTDTSGNDDTATHDVEVVEEITMSPGPIDTCGVLETPGVYTLTTDLDGQNTVATCFEIKGSDIVLDGQGHTISNGVAEAVHILGTTAPLHNVTVTNLTVTGWESAISAKDLTNSEFSDLTLVENDDKGIVISGSNSSDNLVTRGHFAENQKGVFLEHGGDRTTITDSEFVNNHEVGVKVSGATNSTISNNHFTGQDGEKTIHLTGESPYSTIAGNVVENSTGPENAIQIGGEAHSSIVRDNVVRHNSLGGISIGPANNTVVNNTVYDNGDVGIAFDGDGNTITDNTVYDNRLGLVLTVSSGNVVHDNELRDNAEWDLVLAEGATNNDVQNVVTTGGTTFDLGPTSTDVSLSGASDPGAGTVGDYRALPHFLMVNDSGTAPALDLTLYYDLAPLLGADEQYLTVGRTDGTTNWTGVPGSTVNTGSNSVHATLTDFDATGVVYVAPIWGTDDVTPPVADAGLESDVVAPGANVTFDGSASTDDSDGVLTYEWDLDGDGITDVTNVTAVANFTDEGTHTVTLTVTDAAGNAGTDTVTVYVDVTPPTAVAGDDDVVGYGKIVDFDGSESTDAETGVVAYEWDFGDGMAPSSEVSPSHGFYTEGLHNVTLTVWDAAGNNDSDVVNITVDASIPVAVIGGDDTQSVYVGDSVTFDAGGSSDDLGIDTYEWDFGDGTTASGIYTAHAYTAPGTYTVTLTVTDAVGNTDTDTVTVVVVTRPTGGDDGDDSGNVDSGNSGHSGGGGSSVAPGDGIRVSRHTDGAIVVEVTDAKTGQETDVDLTLFAMDAKTGIQLRSLSVTTTVDTDYTVKIWTRPDVADGERVLGVGEGATPIGYLDIGHSFPDEDIESMTVTYRVRVDRLESAGIQPEDVALYRYDDGEWTALPTDVVGETGDYYDFRSTSPGMSHLSVGAGSTPFLDVLDASLDADAITPGDSVTVTADVANVVSAQTLSRLSLYVDGVAVDAEDLEMRPGEATTVAFDYTFETAGTYEVRVDDHVVGTVTVADATPVVTDAPEPPAQVDDPTTSTRSPGFGALVALVALVAAALLARRRMR